MNYRELIETYDKEGKLPYMETTLCARFYHDVTWFIEQARMRGRKADFGEAMRVYAKAYKMTEDEAEAVYGIGKERKENIDSQRFYRIEDKWVKSKAKAGLSDAVKKHRRERNMEIIRLHEQGVNTKRLARMFELDESWVREIIKNKN